MVGRRRYRAVIALRFSGQPRACICAADLETELRPVGNETILAYKTTPYYTVYGDVARVTIQSLKANADFARGHAPAAQPAQKAQSTGRPCDALLGSWDAIPSTDCGRVTVRCNFLQKRRPNSLTVGANVFSIDSGCRESVEYRGIDSICVTIYVL